MSSVVRLPKEVDLSVHDDLDQRVYRMRWGSRYVQASVDKYVLAQGDAKVIEEALIQKMYKQLGELKEPLGVEIIQEDSEPPEKRPRVLPWTLSELAERT